MAFNTTGEARDLPLISTQPAGFEAFYREHLPFVRVYLARRIPDPLLR